MPIDEAINILQVPATFTAEEVEQRFEKLFNLNDPAKGGSFFIQCKVRGAKITLIKHLEPEPSAPETTEGESDPKPNENKETNN
jgi:import inner membrane translocase subunit TIM16